jgi:hypothetical protein
MASGNQLNNGICALLPVAASSRRQHHQGGDRGRERPGFFEHPDVGEGPGTREQQEHRRKQSDVADAVVDESLLAGRRGCVAVEVETHEPVGANSHTLPTHEGEHQVVGEHQSQHGEDEEVEVEEELLVILLPVHVTNGIEVNQRRDARHEQSTW